MVQTYWELPEDGDLRPELFDPWILRIVLDRELMIDKKLNVADVAAAISNEFPGDIHVVFSNEFEENQVIRIRIVPREEDKESLVITTEDSLRTLKEIESEILNNVKLRGYEGVTKVYLREVKTPKVDQTTGAFIQSKEWILDTEGIALLSVLSVPGVDSVRTASNHVHEINDVLGIEAARKSLLNELRHVISFDGSYINYRHLAMLVDVMTARGYLMAVSRQGINRTELPALTRCSFEETVDMLFEAAMYAETDPIQGPTPSIMLGQDSRLGSGVIDCFINETLLEEAVSAVFDGKSSESTMIMEEVASASTPMVEGAFTENTFNSGFMADANVAWSPALSPIAATDYPASPGIAPSPFLPVASPHIRSAGYSLSEPSPHWVPQSPFVPAQSPFVPPTIGFSPSSPMSASPGQYFAGYSGGYNPSMGYSPSSPTYQALPTSPSYSVGYSPSSPAYGSPSGVGFSGYTAGGYSPSSPLYGANPTSPSYASYSPSSPNYSPGTSYTPGAYSPTLSYSPGSYSPS
ncbi:hypothetical protein GEMRC1_002518 [Eukaryota sp. GEM-RC1]